ncbi:MAG: signal peptide peptidase SppA [Gammaproteobacteria bacterium]|nr:signal peptide peptidase SppA [Gammaproteobacteria bacterium]
MSVRNTMRGFFAGVARAFAFLRVAIANLFVGLLLLAFVAAVLMGGSQGPNVPDDTALVVAPKGAIVEQTGTPDPVPALLGVGGSGQVAAADLLRAIERATSDDRVAVLSMDLSDLWYVSTAHVESLGSAIRAFQDAGKKVIASSENYTQDRYLLASFADEVYLHPFGQVMLPGYGMYRDYYSGLLDKLKVNVHVFRVGTYKAAVEPFTRPDMSPEAREANLALVTDLWGSYVNSVAENRNMTPEAVRRFADEYDMLLEDVGGDPARAALEHGLVDELLTREALRERLAAEVGEEDADDLSRTGFPNYLRATGPELPASGDRIAVVVAQGAIQMGDQSRGSVGSDSTARLIRRAREDDAVKAVVLRVDSPGGSAFASEVIRQELELAQTAGKPVVASMAGVAASGGYWISATADEIWASPTTITGSIGVFSMIPGLEESFSSIGITRDGVGSSALSDSYDLFSGVTERMGTILQATVDHTYERFLNLVARGRDMSVEDVDAVGQGRVWTGRKALELGLVDGLGDLERAVEAAARLADIEDYSVEVMEKPLSTGEQLLMRFADNLGLAESATADWVRRALAGVEELHALNDPGHIYAICASCPGR